MYVDVTEDISVLTIEQIAARLTMARDERKAIKEGTDKSVAASKRSRELLTYIEDLKAAEKVFEGAFDDEEPEPAPEAVKAQVIDTPTATPIPEGNAPAPAALPDAEDALQAPAAEQPAPADPEDGGDAIAQALTVIEGALADEGIMEQVRSGVGVEHDESQGESLSPDQVFAPGETVNGVPIMATTAKGSPIESNQRTTLDAVGATLQGIKSAWQHLSLTDTVPLFQTNRQTTEVPAELWLGEDIKANSELLFGNDTRQADAIAAATGLGFCGDPVKIQVAGCPIDASTPFMDVLAANSVSARNCAIEWELPLSFADISPGPSLWTSDCVDSDQDGVDAADPGTWKPIAAELPDCPTKCRAYPIDSVVGLKVTINDELCRPEKIEEANRALECLHAVLLEKTAMTVYDNSVGPTHHFTFDAAETTLGAYPSLVYALMALTSTFGFDRKDAVAPGGLVAAVHPSIIATIKMDLFLAEMQASQVDALIAQAFSMAGIGRVMYLKDWGECEGELFGSLPSNEIICDIGNCEIPSLSANCVAFGSSANKIPQLADKARIRIFNPENWWHGWDWLVDYQFRKSPEMLRQNCGEWFGERRDTLFKASNCGAFEAILDVVNLCATGQRVDASGSFPCPAPDSTLVLPSSSSGPLGAPEKIEVISTGDLADKAPAVPGTQPAVKADTTQVDVEPEAKGK